MNGEEQSQLKEIYQSVIRLEETMKWLKDNYEIQRICCEKHEKRINNLEVCGGRIKGIFATVTTAVIILSGIVVILLAKLFWK